MRIILLLMVAVNAFAADDSWSKIADLKTGSELKIYKKGSREPITATFGDTTAERLVIIVKNRQSSIPKEDIDRIDARPVSKSKSKMTVNTISKETPPDTTPHPQAGLPVPTTSSSSDVSFGGTPKPDFETIYTRPSKASEQTQPHPPSAVR